MKKPTALLAMWGGLGIFEPLPLCFREMTERFWLTPKLWRTGINAIIFAAPAEAGTKSEKAGTAAPA
jgi:hypothetical protein